MKSTEIKPLSSILMILKLLRLLFVSAALCRALAASAEPVDPLQFGFLNPPDSARPQTWWHWMNGNITSPDQNAKISGVEILKP